MNMKYKILWIDDSEDYIESTQEIIEDAVKDNNMIPQIKVYSKYEEYKEKELDTFDKDVFNLYDQIIIDHALSETTGDKIIRDLRGRNIYTDIVFYSSNYTSMIQALKDSGEHLDGVFYSTRESIVSTIDKVIKKNLKREYNIANIRGLIMDSTSEFDYICRVVSLELFSKLSADDKKEVIDKVKEYVASAQHNSESNFSKLNELQGDKFIKESMTSVEYVMNNKDRYAIMALIIRTLEDNTVFDEDFPEAYKNDLITPRNDLAHNKLYYGTCQKKIHIAKKKQGLVCNNQCEHCNSKYSIESCEKLREAIFKYYQIFNEVFEQNIQ